MVDVITQLHAAADQSGRLTGRHSPVCEAIDAGIREIVLLRRKVLELTAKVAEQQHAS